MELEKLKRRRTSARKNFTVGANLLENALNAKPVQLGELPGLYEYARNYAEPLFALEDRVMEEWLDYLPEYEEEYEADQDRAREYLLRWTKLKHQADAAIATPTSPMKQKSINETGKDSDADERTISEKSVSTAKSRTNTQKTHSSKVSEQKSELDWQSASGSTKSEEKGNRRNNLRLPKLELQKFNGDLKRWIAFWGQFQQIDRDDSIDDHDKFQYLIQATEEGSPARRLVQSYPPSAENYKKAIKSLKERFAREDLLIEIYVRELLHLVSNQNKDSLKLGELYDQLITQVKALETLGVTSKKYAAMLFPLIESAVPEDILKAWERAHCESDENLDSLLRFLKKEVRIEERLKISRKETTAETNKLQPTATCLTALPKEERKVKETTLCVWCDNKHPTTECLKVVDWTLEQRKKVLSQKKACYYCFKKHGFKKCFFRSRVKCLVCNQTHQTLLCPNSKLKEDAAEGPKKDPKPNPSAANVAQFTIKTQSTVTLLQTLKVKITNGSVSQEVRAFLDSGAQRSYILHDVTAKLNLKPNGKEILGHCLFGGIETKKEEHDIFEFVVEGLKSGKKLQMSALQKEVITGNLPRLPRSHELMFQLKRHNVELSDYDDESSQVGLLIGADYLGAITTKELIQLDKGVIAVKTTLGWTIQGPVINACTVTNNVVLANNISISELWDLETLGIREPAKTPLQSETSAEIMTKFRESVTINDEGRYEVNLPWKPSDAALLSNRDLAEKRLQSTTQRLLKLNEVTAYGKVFEEWLDLDIIEPTTDDKDEGHYLSHHAVIKESSLTTRVRPVFNASAKDKNGISLNELLEKGVNYLEMIPKLIIQFRKHAIGITADIKKAFLQISLKPEDRIFLKFLWWKDDKMDEAIVYRHRRVVFGLTSSPFLLAATIIHHLEKYTTRFKDTAKQLLESFYVDNCVTSVDTEEAAKKFIQEGKEVMREGKFELRGWVTAPMTNEEMTESDNILSVLGSGWNTVDDMMGCRLAPNESKTTTKKPTQRDLMSVAQKIFDPIGITCPTTLIPKRLLQESYKLKCKLDRPLPENIIETYTKWLKEVEAILDCRVPRRLTENQIHESSNGLHIFCDASQTSYAACIFLRSEFKGEVSVKLIMAKSRVAPLEDITVPRLELLGALIASRLFLQVKEALDMECETFFWTDSSVVLTWITTKGDWGVWVRNRVKEIRELTNPENWRHLPGTMNPADLPSRGCFPKTLRKSKWWKGPDWLKLNKEYWPSCEPVIDHVEVDKEKMKRAAVHLTNDVAKTKNILQGAVYFSKYPKMVRMIAWVKRFLHNCRENERIHGDISFEEYREAEVTLLKLVQKEEEDKRMTNFQTFKDSEGLIRIRTKLLHAEDSPEFKTPILLKGKHAVVRRLVEHTHRLLKHAGPGVTITQLREKYWIIAIRRLVKEVIRKCLSCKRERSKPTYIPPAPLPLNRIKPTATFEVTGIDLAGPLILRSGEKAWIVIFTCAVYRAIHLEITNALSTEAFLMSLRRFIARRGRPNVIYTDNGTNFHGAANELSGLDWKHITALSNIQKMKWIFNPPSAPWWGGFWERLIRSVKDLLKRNLGNSVVDYEELYTLICECESLINARPLTFVSDDLCRPLSPDCFLKMVKNSDTNDLDEIDHNSLNIRHKYVQKLRQDLRERFRSEYLALLTQRRTNSAEILRIGDVVLIETPEKRIHWPMGIIQELVKGQDGIARVAKVKTRRGVVERPVQRLHQLELSSMDQQHEPGETEETPEIIVQEEIPTETQEQEQLRTRRGRAVRLPQRFR